MTRYVAGFLFRHDLREVVLIRKNHPDWMAGKLTGVGGHIEEGETPEQAMCREFQEEAGAEVTDWRHYVHLKGHNNGGWSVDFFWAHEPQRPQYVIRSCTTESVGWVSVSMVLCNEYVHMPSLPNVRWLIPMAINDIQGVDNCVEFTITESILRSACTSK